MNFDTAKWTFITVVIIAYGWIVYQDRKINEAKKEVVYGEEVISSTITVTGMFEMDSKIDFEMPCSTCVVVAVERY